MTISFYCFLLIITYVFGDKLLSMANHVAQQKFEGIVYDLHKQSLQNSQNILAIC